MTFKNFHIKLMFTMSIFLGKWLSAFGVCSSNLYKSRSGLCLEIGVGRDGLIKIWGIVEEPVFFQERSLPFCIRGIKGALEIGTSNILFLWTFRGSWGWVLSLINVTILSSCIVTLYGLTILVRSLIGNSPYSLSFAGMNARSLFKIEQLQQILARTQKSMIDQLFRNKQPSFAVHFIRMCRVVAGTTNRSHVRISRAFTVAVAAFGRKSSRKQTVLYLKTCQILLQQVVAGQYTKDLSPFGARVARTKRGLPRIIPRVIRSRIMVGDRLWIRIFMTLFGVYRIIEFPGKLKLKTITQPSTVDIMPVYRELRFFLPRFFRTLHNMTYRKWTGLDPKILAPEMFPISKAGMLPGFASTKVDSVFLTAFAWLNHHPLLLSFYKDWINIVGSESFFFYLEKWGSDPFVKQVGSHKVLPLGRLSLKDEPAGKIRVFAIVDCWTQWIMRPLHDLLFDLLKGIPQDGTFDQAKPLKALTDRNLRYYASYDLSAATDRLPVLLQSLILSFMFGERFALVWQKLLTLRPYELVLSHVHRKPGVTFRNFKILRKRTTVLETKYLQYAVGQPMGALSSWAMLALTHHAIVQLASFQVRGHAVRWTWFKDYAVLGDDIVIADPAVSKRYLSLMTEGLGVEINLSKSVISTSGNTMEFAKRFIVLGVDCSMFPIKEYIAAINTLGVLLEVVRKYSLSVASTLSLLGYGYRAKANLSLPFSRMGQRCKRLILALFSPGGVYGTTWAEFLTMESLFTRKAPNNIGSAFATFVNRELKSIGQRLDHIRRLMKDALLAIGMTLDGQVIDMKYPYLEKDGVKSILHWTVGPYNYSHTCELVAFLYMENIQTNFSLFRALQQKAKVWDKYLLSTDVVTFKKLLKVLDEFYRAEDLFTEITVPTEMDSRLRETVVKTDTRSVRRWFVLTARFRWMK